MPASRSVRTTGALVLAGLVALAGAHAALDLRADAQSAIALVFIPIYALLPIAIGGVVGWWVDRRLRARGAP